MTPPELIEEKNGDTRLGKTGVWTFLASDTGIGVLAKSEWGAEFWFAKEQWEALPVLVPEAEAAALDRIERMIE